MREAPLTSALNEPFDTAADVKRGACPSSELPAFNGLYPSIVR
jgi:hypothetical protein